MNYTLSVLMSPVEPREHRWRLACHLSPIDNGDTLSNDDICLPMVGETRNAEDSVKEPNTRRMLMLEWHFICRVGHRLDLVFIAKINQ